MTDQAGIGIVLVSYGSGDVLPDCLESLLVARQRALAKDEPPVRIVVVDNDSPDDTLDHLRDWASGRTDYSWPSTAPFALDPVPKPVAMAEGGPNLAPADAVVTLVHSGANLGFAGGVNVGLAHLARDPAIGHFWILNPDSAVPPGSLEALVRHLGGGAAYGLLGGRVIYFDRPDRIQIDGGRVDFRTGVSDNHNLGRPANSPPPDPAALDFITGASVVASRTFYERVGPMPEEYFLYYEEVDWALRRGEMPLDYCAGLVVYHRAGTAIGSPTGRRRASPFSLYFKHRGRMRFLRRFNPRALPIGYAYGLAVVARCLRDRDALGARAVLAALHDRAPPDFVSARLSPAALNKITGA